MTGGSGGQGSGSGRHHGRFAEIAKPAAAVLTGVAALAGGLAGMITLVCSDPAGNPASAATTTVSSVTAPSTSSPAPPSTPATPPAPAPQFEGDVQIDSLGYSLATVPPSPDQSGDPDISATFGGTFFATLGAAKWSGRAAPSPQACAALILVGSSTHVNALPGDLYCLRIAHRAVNRGSQYAVVRVLGQGRDETDFPYVRIHAMVWPDQD